MSYDDAKLLWSRLQMRDGAWRTPVLATIDETLGADARTIVLRDCHPGQRELFFHSARDADKIRQLKRDSRGTLLVYDAEAAIQLRLYGRMDIVNDHSMLDKAWQVLADNQQKLYSLQRRIRSRENFAMVRFTVHAMHLLELAADGENRATEFRWSNGNAAGNSDGAWIRQEVAP